jgi:hypothetical protein
LSINVDVFDVLIISRIDKSNTTQYSVYDYQGNRVRSVVESNNQAQSQRDYLPSLDISTNQDGEGLLPITTVCLV